MEDPIKKDLEKIKASKVWSFFIIKRPVAWLATIAITIMGIFSATSLPQEIQPEIVIPYAAVITALPGANPTDVESLLTEPLEKNIGTISEIKTMSSTSGFGFSAISIEFNTGTNIDDAIQKVKDEVDLISPTLPEDATTPTVKKAEANAFSIITFSVTGPRPIHELTKIAKDIKSELEKIKDISSVQIAGESEKYIEILIDQSKAENFGLDITSIASIVKYANNNLPVGIISSDNLNYSIRIDNRFSSLEDIQNLPLFTFPDENSTPVLLKDIATVQESYPSQSVITKLSIANNPSQNAVSLQIFKKENTNIISIADKTKETIQKLKDNQLIPSDTKVEVSNDNSAFIREELGNLIDSGIEIGIIITVILFLSLGLVPGIMAGILSIPLALLTTFTVMQITGLSFNTLSLFSLVIALGLMVDTNIVIMQGMDEYLKKGMSPLDSALLSLQVYKWPLTASALTTIFAFFPMLLVSGILGEFLKTMPIVISTTLFAALVISFTIEPSLAVRFVKQSKKGEKRSLLGPLLDKIGEKFHTLITLIVRSVTAKLIVILITITAFVLSLSLPITGILKVEMFAKTDQNYFTIQIEAPKGTPLNRTKKIAEQVEKYLYKIPEIETFLTKIGTSQSEGLSSEDTFFQGGTSDSNLANITVNLTEKGTRKKSFKITEDLRKSFIEIKTAKIEIRELQEGPPGDTAITARITGKDLEVLKKIADKVKNIIEKFEGTTNTQISLKSGLNEFKFSLDRDALAYHGLSSIQTTALIRSIIQGIKITEIKLNGNEDMDLIAKYNLPMENNSINMSIQDLENIQITTPKGYQVTLGDIGKYEFGQSTSGIDRENQKRIIKVTSDVKKGVNSVDAIAKIQEETSKLELPNGYEISFGGDLEQINESFRDLFKSMIVGIILIGFCLVLMFNSFKQTMIILITVPLAIIGVCPGLLIMGLNLSFPAFLGVVALCGIVVNNAIVLIDKINKNREEGMEFAQAIGESTNSRLQPILMTSITTIVGTIPLAMTNEMWAGLGYALIFGISISTLLTLIVIPVFYYLFEIRQEKKRIEEK